MLVSMRHKIAFAHYPKTAGVAMSHWFRETFPDAEYLVTENPHLPVDESLDLLRRRLRKDPMKAISFLAARARRGAGIQDHTWAEPNWRVLGVIRDPLEMLVSLYEFWRSFPFLSPPTDPLVQCARCHTFRDFVAAAIIGRLVIPYERFFDRGGPLWGRTTLIEFSELPHALQRFCLQAGISTAVPLRVANRTPDMGRDLKRYAEEIGTLMDDLRQHFKWYYGRPTSVDGLLAAE